MGYAVILSSNVSTPAVPPPGVPVGTLNGTNTVFTLASANLQALVLNGVVQNPGSGSPISGADYSLSGVTVTFTVPPVASDWMMAYYSH